MCEGNQRIRICKRLKIWNSSECAIQKKFPNFLVPSVFRNPLYSV